MITPCPIERCNWKSWSDRPNLSIRGHINRWHKGMKGPRGPEISLLSTPDMERPLNNRGTQ